MRSFIFGLLVILSAVAGASFEPGSASAQSATSATSLVAVLNLAEDRNQSVFKLLFSPRYGTYEIKPGDGGGPALLLTRSGRSSDLAARPQFGGFVRAIEMDARDDGLLVRFITSGPA